MKPVPNPNYNVDIRDLAGEHWMQPDLARWLKRGWLLTLNHSTSISFLPHVPTTPWPLPPVEDLDHAQDADEAARIIIATSGLIVAPTDGVTRIEEFVSDPVWERQSLFWVSRSRYAQLDREIEALHRRPRHKAHPDLRVEDLPDGELRTFLDRDLPRATALDDYDRKLLCLPPLVVTTDG